MFCDVFMWNWFDLSTMTYPGEILLREPKMQDHLLQTVLSFLFLKNHKFPNKLNTVIIPSYYEKLKKITMHKVWRLHIRFRYWKFLYTFWGDTNKYIICHTANSKSIWWHFNIRLKYRYLFAAALKHPLFQ